MKDLLKKFNKIFENRVRLGVMSMLMVKDWMDFNQLKETLGLTDGNLASNISSLENAGYILIKKEFVGKKPQTTYKATEKGRKAFREHLDAVEEILKSGMNSGAKGKKTK